MINFLFGSFPMRISILFLYFLLAVMSSFEAGGLELVKSALLVWCPNPYTTVL
jgi:hypothetical protein